jgi:SAM-dependent methyltransferase
MQEQAHPWQTEELAKTFLEDVRAAIPLAAEQIEVLLCVVRAAVGQVTRFADLGCGDGILGRAVLARYPAARGVFLDFSAPMMAAARKAMQTEGRQATFVVQDLAAKSWQDAIARDGPLDLVVSGLAIHHLSDERKRELYAEIFALLRPGGLFLNLEHVAFRSPWAEQAFDDLFVDFLWSYHKSRGGDKPRDEVAQQWYYRRDKQTNLLAPVEVQCRWLEEIGFVDVDCFFKLFQLALFGGRKP